MPRPVVLIGAGGHGRELLDIVEALQGVGEPFVVLGFLSDYPVNEERVHARRYEVLGGIDTLEGLDCEYVLAIGDGRARREIEARIGAPDRGVAALVHPSAARAASSSVGAGLVMAAGSRIGPGVVAGRRVHLNTNATIGAGAVVGDDVTVSPGGVIEDDAEVGPLVFVGAGALIASGVRIGADCMVGAGAVVQADMPAGSTVAGSPAHPTGR